MKSTSFAAIASVVTVLVTSIPVAIAWQPTKPVEIVVSAGAGGGTDQLARLIQSIIVKHKLMDQATVVINKGGGSGAEAFLYAKLASGDANKVVVGTNNEYLLPLIASVGYKWDDLIPVAALAQDDFLLLTYTDAPYKTAKEYLDAVKADTSKFKMGGSQSKDVDQTLTKLIDRVYGTKFTYIPFKSGGEAATQLVGMHITSNVNNPNENISQWRAGQVKPLCVFSAARMAYTQKVTATLAWSDVPTCKEQGIAIEEYRMPRALYMPGGVTQEQVAYYVDLLRKVAETPEWKDYLDRNALAPTFLTGDAFVRFIRDDEQRARKSFADEGWLVK